MKKIKMLLDSPSRNRLFYKNVCLKSAENIFHPYNEVKYYLYIQKVI